MQTKAQPWFYIALSGVWWQRFLPVIHQHVSRPALWPAGTGSHLWRTCCGCRFWQPLLQNLPLPPVVGLLPQHIPALSVHTLPYPLVWSNWQICTHPFLLGVCSCLTVLHIVHFVSGITFVSKSTELGSLVWMKCDIFCYSRQLLMICFFQGVTHNLVHIPC